MIASSRECHSYLCYKNKVCLIYLAPREGHEFKFARKVIDGSIIVPCLDQVRIPAWYMVAKAFGGPGEVAAGLSQISATGSRQQATYMY